MFDDDNDFHSGWETDDAHPDRTLLRAPLYTQHHHHQTAAVREILLSSAGGGKRVDSRGQTVAANRTDRKANQIPALDDDGDREESLRKGKEGHTNVVLSANSFFSEDERWEKNKQDSRGGEASAGDRHGIVVLPHPEGHFLPSESAREHANAMRGDQSFGYHAGAEPSIDTAAESIRPHRSESEVVSSPLQQQNHNIRNYGDVNVSIDNPTESSAGEGDDGETPLSLPSTHKNKNRKTIDNNTDRRGGGGVVKIIEANPSDLPPSVNPASSSSFSFAPHKVHPDVSSESALIETKNNTNNGARTNLQREEEEEEEAKNNYTTEPLLPNAAGFVRVPSVSISQYKKYSSFSYMSSGAGRRGRLGGEQDDDAHGAGPSAFASASLSSMNMNHTYSGYGTPAASGDETDINSYVRSRQFKREIFQSPSEFNNKTTSRTEGGSGRGGEANDGSVVVGGNVRDSDVRRQQMYGKTTRIYGYRAPRLHEQRAEILRERYAEGLSTPVKVGPVGGVCTNNGNVTAADWDSRVAPRPHDKKASVFAAPPLPQAPTRGAALLGAGGRGRKGGVGARGAGPSNNIRSKGKGRTRGRDLNTTAEDKAGKAIRPPKVGMALADSDSESDIDDNSVSENDADDDQDAFENAAAENDEQRDINHQSPADCGDDICMSESQEEVRGRAPQYSYSLKERDSRGDRRVGGTRRVGARQLISDERRAEAKAAVENYISPAVMHTTTSPVPQPADVIPEAGTSDTQVLKIGVKSDSEVEARVLENKEEREKEQCALVEKNPCERQMSSARPRPLSAENIFLTEVVGKNKVEPSQKQMLEGKDGDSTYLRAATPHRSTVSVSDRDRSPLAFEAASRAISEALRKSPSRFEGSDDEQREEDSERDKSVTTQGTPTLLGQFEADVGRNSKHLDASPPTPSPSLSDDERDALNDAIVAAKALLGRVVEDFEAKSAHRRELRKLANEKSELVITIASENEVTKAQVKACERAVAALMSKKRTAVASVREAEFKDKQIRDLERMVKAVKERLERKKEERLRKEEEVRAKKDRDLQTALLPPIYGRSAATNPTQLTGGFENNVVDLIVYPVGASIKEKLRIVSAKRAALLKHVTALKTDQDVLHLQIAERETRNRQAQLVRAAQQKRIDDEREAVRITFEKKELESVERELAKLRDDHEKAMAHRSRVVKQAVAKRSAEMEELTKKASTAKVGETDVAKLMSDLQKTLARHSFDLDAAERELAVTLKETAQLTEKRRELETDLEQKSRQLATRQRELSDVHALNRVTTEESRSVSEAFEKELAAVRNASAVASAKAEKAQKELDEAINADEKATFHHEQSISKNGTVEQLTARIAEVNGAIDSLVADRARQAAIFEEAKKRQEAESREEDRVIESLTKGLATRRTAFAAANARNSDLLQKLDTAERLVAMYNLKRS